MSIQWVADSAAYLVPRQEGHGNAWQEEAALQGRVGTSRIIEVAETRAPDAIIDALNLNDEPAVVRRRVMYLDGRPVELTESYYPAAIARDTRLADMRKIPGGATTLLAELGYRPSRVEEYVEADQPTPEQRGLLDLADREPVLVLTRVVRTAGGVPFECSVMTMAKDARLAYRTQVEC